MQRRFHDSGADHVRGYIILAHFGGDTLGKPDNYEFRSAIRPKFRESLLSDNRRDVDNAPRLRAIIPGRAALQLKKSPYRLVARILSHSLFSMSRRLDTWDIPALFTSISMSPKRAFICVTTRLAWSSRQTSCSYASALRPRSNNEFATVFAADTFMAVMATVAPYSASLIHTASPIPFDQPPPVTSATRPLKSGTFGSLGSKPNQRVELERSS